MYVAQQSFALSDKWGGETSSMTAKPFHGFVEIDLTGVAPDASPILSC